MRRCGGVIDKKSAVTVDSTILTSRSYGSSKKDHAISFHYVGQTYRKPILCPDCPDQYWTLYTDYYLGGNEEYFDRINEIMKWVGTDHVPDEDGMDERTAEIAKLVDQKLGERIDGANKDEEFARWEAWAQIIINKSKV